jgi:copper homeostasis protein (lipoprotein)
MRTSASIAVRRFPSGLFLPASNVSAARFVRALTGVPGLLIVCMTYAPGTEAADALSTTLPASFAGALPCGGSAGVRAHLDLWPDGVFHLQRSCAGNPAREDDRGRWHSTPQRDGIRLHGGREMPLVLLWRGPDLLIPLDAQGHEIADSSLQLHRLPDFRPAPLASSLHGMFRYLADAASFVECLTGRSYPVAMEGDYIALESAYLASEAGGTGAAIMTSFDGEITDRPSQDGERTTPTVIVRRFVNLWPGGQCERAMGHASLAETYWRLVRLRGAQVVTPQGRREAHLVLRSRDGRYQGNFACFRYEGQYQVNGDELSFGAPRWAVDGACGQPDPNSKAPSRSDYTTALRAAKRWTINADVLEWFDDAGSSLALFEAVYLR